MHTFPIKTCNFHFYTMYGSATDITPPASSLCPTAAKPQPVISSETAKIWSLSADDVLDNDIVSDLTINGD